MVIFDQSWTKTRTLTSAACKPEPLKPNKRSVNEEEIKPLKVENHEPLIIEHHEVAAPVVTVVKPPPISGGYQKADINDKDIKDMADFATETLASSLNDGNTLFLTDVGN